MLLQQFLSDNNEKTRVSAPSCRKLACKLVVQSHEDFHEQPVENCMWATGAECGSNATKQLQDMDRVNTLSYIYIYRSTIDIPMGLPFESSWKLFSELVQRSLPQPPTTHCPVKIMAYRNHTGNTVAFDRLDSETQALVLVTELGIGMMSSSSLSDLQGFTTKGLP